MNADSLTVGGGIFTGINSIIVDNEITNNSLFSESESYGGGIEAVNIFDIGNVGEIYLSDNTISDNQVVSTGSYAYSGGMELIFPEIYVYRNIINNNSISSNYVNFGAGASIIYAETGEGIKNNFFGNNSFSNGVNLGGGLYIVLASDILIQQNNITLNSSTNGGGMCISASSPLIRKNLIVQNTAEIGGGLWIEGPAKNENKSEYVLDKKYTRHAFILKSKYKTSYKLNNKTFIKAVENSKLINNTIANNTAMISGGGINTLFSSPSILNSIIWGNQSPDKSQIEGAPYVSYSDVQNGYVGFANINLDPQFVGHYHLDIHNSPCIDAGNPDSIYNDAEDPNNPGFALWPAVGTLRNDMGFYGGDPDNVYSSGSIFGTQFNAFVNRVINAPYPLRNSIVDSFLSTVSAFPIIEDSTIVY